MDFPMSLTQAAAAAAAAAVQANTTDFFTHLQQKQNEFDLIAKNHLDLFARNNSHHHNNNNSISSNNNNKTNFDNENGNHAIGGGGGSENEAPKNSSSRNDDRKREQRYFQVIVSIYIVTPLRLIHREASIITLCDRVTNTSSQLILLWKWANR